MRSDAVLIALSLLAVACAGAPVEHPPVPVAVELPKVEPPVAPLTVNVVAMASPKTFALDGNLAEWGAFPPVVPAVPLLDQENASDDTKPLPNPVDATARVAFSLTTEALLVAIDLGGEVGSPSAPAVWFGVASRVPGVALLGQPGGRAGFVPLQCEVEVHCASAGEGDVCQPNGDPLAPEVAAACRALLARHAELEAAHAKRFSRVYRVDAKGVHDAASGALVPGARAAWGHGSKGATAEVVLPLAALPRMADAPVERLGLFASTTASDEPAARWVGVALPSPVAFRPYADLRARAFARQTESDRRNTPPGMTLFEQPLGMSYQPGDPLHVERMVFDSGAVNVVTPKEVPLVEPDAKLGDVEIAVLQVGLVWPTVAILMKDKPLELHERADRAQVAERDGELHVGFWNGKAWTVRAVTRDGARREALVPYIPRAERQVKAKPAPWDSRDLIAGAGLDGFGWRAARGGEGVEVTYRWDPALRAYVGGERTFKIPKATKKTAKAPGRQGR